MPDKKIRRDPVCGMLVEKINSGLVSIYKGKEYYFCSPECKQAFDLDPEKYISKKIAD